MTGRADLSTPHLSRCVCALNRVLSSHAELTALFMTGSGVSGQGNTFHNRLHMLPLDVTQNASHCAPRAFSPAKVCTIILILQLRKQRPEILSKIT